MENVSDEQRKKCQVIVLFALMEELRKLQKQSDILNQPSGEYCKTINKCLEKLLPTIVPKIAKKFEIPEQTIWSVILDKKFFYKILTIRRDFLCSSSAETLKNYALDIETVPKVVANSYYNNLKGLNEKFHNKDINAPPSLKKKVTLSFLFEGSWMHVRINADISIEGEPSINLYRMYCTFKNPSVINADTLYSLAVQLHEKKWSGEMKIPDNLEWLLRRRDAFVVYAPNESGLRQAYEIINAFCEKQKFEVQYDYGKTFFGGAETGEACLSYHEALANYLADQTYFKKRYGENALDELMQEVEKIRRVVEGVNIEGQQEPEPPDFLN